MNTSYTLKLSGQSQLTLPKKLRDELHLVPGARITVIVTDDNNLRLSDKLPIDKHFGALPGAWTDHKQDAAEYSRSLRDSMQPIKRIRIQ
ncbi:MAG: AbrB/MazE/SpoVT family DNA-binding domain-containing protein [Candidatus Saccharimonadales bacterium]